MLRRLIKIVLVLAALKAVGAVLTRRLNHGLDVEANEFSLATAFGGIDRESRATALRRGDVLAVCGGAQIDLRDAVVSSTGAELRLRAIMGGIQVVVPDTWRVTLEPSSIGGAIDLSVTPEDELALDAPSLRVAATAVLGGIQVTTEVDDEENPDDASRNADG